jgi:hypothetical protein
MSLRFPTRRFVMGALVVALTMTVLVAIRLATLPVLNPGLSADLPTLLIFPLVTLPLLPDMLAP